MGRRWSILIGPAPTFPSFSLKATSPSKTHRGFWNCLGLGAGQGDGASIVVVSRRSREDWSGRSCMANTAVRGGIWLDGCWGFPHPGGNFPVRFWFDRPGCFGPAKPSRVSRLIDPRGLICAVGAPKKPFLAEGFWRLRAGLGRENGGGPTSIAPAVLAGELPKAGLLRPKTEGER